MIRKEVSDYRSISLCSVIYKLYKMTCKQTPAFLPKLICPLQNAFVPNRDIHDNTIIAHEILSTLKHSQKRVHVNKLDMEKTYDRLDWNITKMFYYYRF